MRLLSRSDQETETAVVDEIGDADSLAERR